MTAASTGQTGKIHGNLWPTLAAAYLAGHQASGGGLVGRPARWGR